MYRFCELISLLPELSLNVFTIGILSGCWNGVRCNRLVLWLLLKPQPRRSLLTCVCLVIMSIYFLSSAHDAQSRWASNFSGHLSFCFTYFAICSGRHLTMFPFSPLFSSETLMTRCFYGTSLHCHEEHQLIRTERNLRLTCPIFPLKSSPSSKLFFWRGKGVKDVKAPPRTVRASVPNVHFP